MIPLAHADRDITDIATRLPHLSACGTKKLKDFQTLSLQWLHVVPSDGLRPDKTFRFTDSSPQQ